MYQLLLPLLPSGGQWAFTQLICKVVQQELSPFHWTCIIKWDFLKIGLWTIWEQLGEEEWQVKNSEQLTPWLWEVNLMGMSLCSESDFGESWKDKPLILNDRERSGKSYRRAHRDYPRIQFQEQVYRRMRKRADMWPNLLWKKPRRYYLWEISTPMFLSFPFKKINTFEHL